MSRHALIIDDEPDILELLDITLSRMGVVAERAANLDAARQKLAQHRYQFCLTDMRLPDGNGIDLVKEVQQSHPQMPIVVLTAHGNMDTAVEAMKAGAYDFITKPVDLEQLRQLVNSALAVSPEPPSGIQEDQLIKGESAAIVALRKKINKLARSQAPVFISGESGSGKELVARSIHAQGPRAKHPFIAVNCGAIPAELVESELFGHRKGSFTGAQKDKEGLFQAAHGGTLFLDEVADLPLDMQVKLLRAIQEKAVRAIGDANETKVDVRILSASHKDLTEAIENGKFRADLYYRINVIEVPVPALRERGSDILLLANYFLHHFANDYNDEPAILSQAASAALAAYDFPGNVRELHNILERAYTLCEGLVIEAADLQLSPIGKNSDTGREPSPPPSHTVSQKLDYDESIPLDDYLADIEREILLTTLDKHRWNRTTAAKALGITFRSLRYRLKKLGLDSDD
ncbi:sigma-54 dependent transcriptional regulator [Halioxenophilus sp. WMMB6]|uniref:sigma-54-dependent transcriptional regulator n=1 Tax=Halioxenophilus sp. WMMB6 TaxID=3073815 RepID=UPI00295E327B|nr:sigma-54 dependent transcriptional regulator [Halioxenophilus sp. WMMB6]